MSPDIGLAASARGWPDRLHRFLLDHGGGRVVDRVMGPDQALSGTFDVILIDDVCSFLTPHLVSSLKQRGVEVIGVYVPEDGADAKRRLLECGISDVIETEAGPEEFLEKVRQALAHRVDVPAAPPRRERPLAIAVTGATEGVGMTEVAVSLAGALVDRVATVLLDLDQHWPSIAQRLDLPVHPNIRTALDHAVHDPGRLPSALHARGDLLIVGGRADGAQSPPITRHETLTLLEAMSRFCEVVVSDLGPVGRVEGGLLREFDSVIVVGSATPTSVARTIRAVETVRSSVPGSSILIAVNLVTSSPFHRVQTVGHIGEAFPDLAVVALPHDKQLGHASWNGSMTSGARYAKAVRAMSEVVVGALS